MGCACNSGLETRFNDLSRKVDAITDSVLRLTLKLHEIESERITMESRIDSLEVEVCR